MTDPIGSPPATDVSQVHEDPRQVARRLGRELAEVGGPFDMAAAQGRLREVGLDAEPGPLLLEVGQGWCDARDVRAEDFEGETGIDLSTLAGESREGEAPRSGPLTIDGVARGWTLHDERGVDMVGEVLDGRFEIVERIGRGGMGWVFRCNDLALHGQAAVKVLMSRSAEARRRFTDEARLLANVRHPGLVKVHAAGVTEEGAPYLAMEYLGGVSLEQRLRALRGCAAMAGEEVMIEISVEAGRETVVKGEALGHDVDAVGACVRTVAAGLRFAPPTKAETIMKEVQP